MFFIEICFLMLNDLLGPIWLPLLLYLSIFFGVGANCVGDGVGLGVGVADFACSKGVRSLNA